MKDIKIVTWRDSRIYMTQCEEDDNFDYSVLKTVGHVISEDNQKIVLAGDLVDNEIRRVIVIPTENIMSVQMLYLK